MYRLIEFTNEQKYIDSFLSVAVLANKEDKNYVPEGTMDTIAWLSESHKCIGFLKQKNLLVMHGDVPVARGIVFINTIGNFGSIGFFECLEDINAVQALTNGAKAFCKEQGIAIIYAPMNGSIWSNYRLMTKGFEDKPFLGEPYNRPYYRDLLIQCGFKPTKKWETQFIKTIRATGDTASRYLDEEKTQQSKGIKIRSMKNFDTDIRIIHKLAMNSFSQFFCFHELNEKDFVNIYADMKLICDKKTIKIAFNDDNEPIGFGIALPDYRSKLGFILKYAKRYSFIYLGTLQENGESVYPQCGKAIVVSIMRSLFIRRKGCIYAMMSEDAKTLEFSKEYDYVHEYILFELEVD